MNHIKVCLLLFCITASIAQDDGSKTRFDKILQQFGFSGIGAEQPKNIPTVAEGRQQPARATPRTASIPSTGSAKRNRDFEIQSNSIPDTRPRSQTIKETTDSSTALAALFSVAGKAKKPKRPTQNVGISKSRSQQNSSINLPIAKVLNERIENPAFKSVSPSRRIVNNRGLIANERNNRIKDSRRNLRKDVRKKTSPKEGSTLDIRQQLPVFSKPKQQFTSQGIPIVASVTKENKKSSLNKLAAIAGASNIQTQQRSNTFQAVLAVPNSTSQNENTKAKAAIDSVAILAKIAKQKAAKSPLKTKPFRSRGRQPSFQWRNNKEKPKVPQSFNNGRGQLNLQRSNPQPRNPTAQQDFLGVKAIQEASNGPIKNSGKTFDFDATLKDFGFSPRLISGTSFQNKNVPQVKQQTNSQLPQVSKEPFTVFPGNARNHGNQESSIPKFTNKEIPIISSKPRPDSKSGLNSLLELAGDPQNNPVSKTPSPFVSSNQSTNIRKGNIRKGPVQNGRKSPSFQISPTISALGNLESIAVGKGPSEFKVKNRARGPSRNIATTNLDKNNLQTKTQSATKSSISLSKKESVFEINPFVNVNLQKQQTETLRSQNANIQENRNNVRPSKAQLVTNKTEKRVSIPRQRPSPDTSNRPKIFIEKEEFDDSIEEETNERRTEPRKKEQKKQKEERKERPKKKRPKKEKKEQKIEQRPPVVGGCFHVCETLIFEVYKLLGGSLCDCVK